MKKIYFLILLSSVIFGSSAQPLITNSASSLSTTISSCDGTDTLNFTIYNTGSSSMEYNMPYLFPTAGNAHKYAYIANADDDVISILDLSNNTIIDEIPTGSFSQRIATSPNGEFLYASNRDGDDLYVIDVSTNEVTDTIVLGDRPTGIAFTPDGNFAYVGNKYDDNVMVIDCSSKTVVQQIFDNINGPEDIVVSPNGQFVYVANADGDNVTVIATSTNTVVDTILGIERPHSVAITPDGELLYVTETWASNDSVRVISTSNNEITHSIGSFYVPHGVTVSPNGEHIYVADSRNNRVVVIDRKTNTIDTTIVDNDLYRCSDIGVSPDGNFLYVSVSWEVPNIIIIDANTYAIVDDINVYDDGCWGIATTYGSSWITSQYSTSGTINAGDSAVIEVVFSADNMNSGDHYASVEIFSNDTATPYLAIPCTLTIIGVPHISLSDTCLLLDTIMQYATTTSSLFIENTGCDTLFVTNVSNTESDISTDNSTLTILPGEEEELVISFNPQTTGSFSDVITISNSDTDTSICINAYAIEPTNMSFNKDTIWAAFSQCDDSLSTSFTVYNTGVSDLSYNLSGDYSSYDSVSTIFYSTTDETTYHNFTDLYPYGDSILLIITINGDFDLASEYADIYVDGNLVGQMNPTSNNSDITESFALGGSSVSSWLSDGEISVAIDNSSSVNTGFGTMLHEVQLVVNGIDWLTVSVDADTISQGDSSVVDIDFSGMDLNSSNYTSNVIVNSNDPVNPVDTIVFILDIDGDPVIALSDTCLDFGDVFKTGTSNKTVLLFNTGCDTLKISNISNTSADITLDTNQFSVLPGDTGILVVTFSPLSAGNYEDTLVIYSNDTDTMICIGGLSLDPPVLSFNPHSINATMNSCDDSLETAITVHNTGDADLTLELTSNNVLLIGDDARFETMLTNAGYKITNVSDDAIYDGSNPSPENFHAVVLTDGNDYGDDMPASGQIALVDYVNNGGGLVINEWIAWEISNGRYTLMTDLVPFTYSTYNTSTDTYTITEDHPVTQGITGSFAVPYGEYGIGTANSGTVLVTGASAGDAVIAKHLGNGKIVEFASVGSVSGNDPFNDANMELLFTNAVNWVSAGAWHSTDISVDTIVPGDSTIITVLFDANDIISGTYNSPIIISSNDPVLPYDTIACSLTLSGYPLISQSESLIEFDSIMQFSSLSDTITLYNTGCDTLFITDIESSNADFAINDTSFFIIPDDSNSIIVTFSPLSTGTYTDTIFIYNNDTDTIIPVSGFALSPPIISFSTDTINATINNCNDSVEVPFTVYNSGNADLIWNFTGSGISWLNAENIEDTIAPSDSTTTLIEFNSINMISGNYYSEIIISSNDPLSSSDTITCKLTVNGFPILSQSDTLLEYDSIMQYTSKNDTVRFYNSGCDTLFVTDIESTNTDFSANDTSFYISPNDSIDIAVTFNPQNAGAYNDTITVYSNDVDTIICMTGFAISPPIISYTPDSFNVSFTSCDDSTGDYLVIYNTGTTDLVFNADIENETTFDSVSTKYFNSSSETTIHDFPGLSPYSDSIYLDITINGDFDLSSEYADIYVDGDLVGQMNPTDNNINITESFAFGGATVSNWLADGEIRISVDNSSSVGTCCGTRLHEVLLITRGIDWLDISIQKDTIAMGDSSVIAVSFDSENLSEGTYSNSIDIYSNDPQNSSVNIPCTITLDGYPLIELSENCLDLDSLIQWGSKEEVITIYNTGCDTLFVTNMTNDDNDFSIDTADFFVLTNDSMEVTLTFSPTNTGNFYDTIRIYNNATDTSICLAAVATIPAEIVISPDSISSTITICNTSDTIPLTIYNTGDEDLIFDIEQCNWGNTSNDFLIVEHWMNKTHFSDYSYQTVTENSFSSLALSQMNAHKVIYFEPNWTDYANLTNNMANLEEYIRQGGVAVINIAKTSGEATDIDPLGTDYSAALSHNFENFSMPTHDYITGDAFGGNALNITEFNNWWQTDYGTLSNYPDNSEVILSNTDGAALIHYPLGYGHVIISTIAYGWNNAENPQENLIEYAYHLGDNKNLNWLPIVNSELTDTVISGDSTVVDVVIDANEFISGDYSFDLIINSNDPLSLSDTVFCNLSLEGYPVLELSDTLFDFDSMLQWTYVSDTLLMYNNGCDTMFVSNISPTHSDFSTNNTDLFILSGDSAEIIITWSPLSAGDYTDSLHIFNNDIDTFICLSGYAISPPIASINPDSFNVVITSCGDSSIENLTIYNTGDYDLIFDIIGVGEIIYDSTSITNYSGSGTSTDHVFSDLPPTDSIFVTVTINGDFDSSNEYADLYIDGDFIETIDDGNVSNGVDIVKNYTLGGALVDTWLADNEITVTIDNSIEVNDFPTIDRHTVQLSIYGAPWIEISNLGDTIPINDSLEIDVKFLTEDLITGNYPSNIIINSNDPLTSQIIVPCTLSLAGYPVISLSDTCLDFDTVMQWTSVDDTLIINNTGCDTLFVTDITTTSADFVVDTTSLTILAGDSAEVYVSFSPLTAGNYSYDLNIFNSDYDTTICLTGVCNAPPYISTNTDSIYGSINGCEDFDTIPLTIYNADTAGYDLIFSIASDSSWLDFSISTDTIAPGDSANINVLFGEASIVSGFYYSAITINSNDPINPAISVDLAYTKSVMPEAPSLSDTAICFSDATPDLIATGTDIQWYSDLALSVLEHNGNTFSCGETAVGIYTYYVTQTISGCESASDSATLEINSLPAPPVANDNSICFGETTPDFISSGANLLWYSDAALTSLIYLGDTFASGDTAAGTYTYYVADSVGGCGQGPSDTTLLTIHSLPNAPSSVDTAICFGTPTPKLISNGDSIRWYDDAILSNLVSNGDTFANSETVAGTYTYYLTETDTITACESYADTVILTINSIPSVPVLTDRNSCDGETVPNFIAVGNNVQWYSDNALSTLVYSGDTFATGKTAIGEYTYFATQSINNCVSSYDSTSLSIFSIPSAPLTADTSVCYGLSVPELTATGANIKWYSDTALTVLEHNTDTFASVDTEAGIYIYYVTQSINGCESAADSSMLTIDSIPNQPSANDHSICSGESTPDLIAEGISIEWFNNGNLDTLLFSGDTFVTGESSINTYTYYVTQSDTVLGCKSFADTVVLTINAIPAAPVAADEIICFGQNTPKLTSTGDNLNWYSDTLLTVIEYSGDSFASGDVAVGTYNYYVTQTISACESNADTSSLIINPTPTAPTTSNILICFGDTTPNLIASGTEINWYNDSLLSALAYNGDTFASGITARGEYTWHVTQTDTVLSCESNATTSTLSIYAPDAPTSSDEDVCFAETTPDLNASGVNIEWHSDVTTDTLLYSGTTFATTETSVGSYVYYVSQTDSVYGCKSTATTVTLNINDIPTAPITSDETICYGETTPDLTAAGTSIIWYSDSLLSTAVDSTNTYTTGLSTVGEYTFYATQTISNCTSLAEEVLLSIDALPNAPTASNQSICFGDTTPDLISSGTNIEWYNDGSLLSLAHSGDTFTTGKTIASTYTWYLTQTEASTTCRSNADTISLTINSIPTAPASADNNGCEGDTIPTLITTGTNIQWYSDTNLTILEHSGDTFTTSETTAGIYFYYITQTENNCESPADTTRLTIYTTPIAPITTDTSVCYNIANPELIANGSNTIWYSDSILSNVVLIGDSFSSAQTNAGEHTYYVTQTENGCESNAATSTLSIHSLLTAPVADNQSSCLGEAVPELTTSGSNIKWYDAVPDTLLQSGDTLITGKSNVGIYTYYLTQTDSASSCESLKDTVTLTINATPSQPIASNDTICFGQTTPDLLVTGSNTNWYSDGTLDTLIFSGDTFASGEVNSGIYTWYVTQTVANCESKADTTSLIIHTIPTAPTASDQTICYGETTPDLTANGTLISWYNDTLLSNLVGSGTTLSTSDSNSGVYTYFATQTDSVNACESREQSVVLTINSLPDAPEVTGDTICFGETIPSLTAIGDDIQWYTDSTLLSLSDTGNSYIPVDTTAGSYIYYTTQSLLNCEGQAATANFQINPTPAIISENAINETECSSEDGSISITATGTTALQYSIDNGISFSDTSAFDSLGTGSYSVIVQNTFACITNGSTLSISSDNAPIAPATSDESICVGENTPELIATGTNIQWYSNPGLTTLVDTGNSFVSGNTTAGIYEYYVTQTIDSCESLPTPVSLTITETALPVTADKQACYGASVPELIAVGSSIKWYSDSLLSVLEHSGDSFTSGKSTIGNYTWYVTQTENACESMGAPIELSINSLPSTPTVTDAESCFGAIINDLTATGNAIKWYDDSVMTMQLDTGNNYSPNSTTVGNYSFYATQTDASTSCESSVTEANLTIFAIPTAPVSTDETICFGIDASGLSSIGNDIKWYDNGSLDTILFSGSTYTATDTTAGTHYYYATQTENNCESQADTVRFTINTLPIIVSEVTTNETDCDANDGTITISATGDAPLEYSINGGSAFYQNNGAFTGLGNGNYPLMVKNTHGCETIGSIEQITSTNAPAGPTVTDNEICFGENTPDMIATGINTVWYSDQGLSTIVNSTDTFISGITTAGIYTWYVTQTDTSGSCESPSATTTLKINALPEMPMVNNESICEGENTPSLISNGTGIIWYSDSSLSTIIDSGNTFVSGMSSVGTYNWYLTQTDTITSCISEANSVRLEINAIPATPITTNETICYGESTPSLSSSGTNIKWFADSLLTDTLGNGSNYSPIVSAAGNYTYYINDSVNGCVSDIATSTFIINAIPATPSVVGKNICSEESTSLTAIGTNVQWYNDSSLTTLLHNGNTYTSDITTAGNYTYYLSEIANNCESPYTTVDLTIYPLPSAPVTTSETICYGETTPTLTATGANVKWYKDADLSWLITTGNSFNSGETDVMTYTWHVTQTDTIYACTSYPSTSVLTINPSPLVTVNTTLANIDKGQSVTLIAYNASTYSWSPPEGLNTTTGSMVEASPTSTTTYTVVGTNDAGCSNTANVLVVVDGQIGMLENEKMENINIYPNPTTGLITIDFSDTKNDNTEIQIYSFEGQLIRSKKINNSLEKSASFDLRNLKQGIYTLRFISENSVIIKRVIIQY